MGEGKGRIHDRVRWTRSLTARDDGRFDAGAWTATRLTALIRRERSPPSFNDENLAVHGGRASW